MRVQSERTPLDLKSHAGKVVNALVELLSERVELSERSLGDTASLFERVHLGTEVEAEREVGKHPAEWGESKKETEPEEGRQEESDEVREMLARMVGPLGLAVMGWDLEGGCGVEDGVVMDSEGGTRERGGANEGEGASDRGCDTALAEEYVRVAEKLVGSVLCGVLRMCWAECGVEVWCACCFQAQWNRWSLTRARRSSRSSRRPSLANV
eukprot:212400-Rhodomonas_salina.1